MSRDLAAILVAVTLHLSPDEAALLAAALDLDEWKTRQARLDLRDDAIRGALAALPHLDGRSAAKAVADAWTRALRGASVPVPLAGHVTTMVAHHDKPAALSWEQIRRIGRSGRTPPPWA